MTFLLNFTEFICQKIKGDTSIYSKKIVEESLVEASVEGWCDILGWTKQSLLYFFV
jgi:hypothetical protein